ncbi:MAG: transposase [Thermoplasmataceae archaeon]
MFIHEAVIHYVMSGSYVFGIDKKQLLLLPDMIESYIEEDNPTRFVDPFINSINLYDLGFKFSVLNEGAGRPSYDPKDILKLTLWRYYNGIRSSRKLKKQCVVNMEVMWLLYRLSTLQRFLPGTNTSQCLRRGTNN